MYILKCEAFDAEGDSARHNNRCCQPHHKPNDLTYSLTSSREGSCHETGRLIVVTPYAIDATLENRRLDWEMGIQAEVCCGRYEFVRSLSREWWAAKGMEVGLWDRAKVDTLLRRGSWHARMEDSNSLRGRVQGSGYGNVSKATRAKPVSKCPSCGSKWNGEVCENCGHGFGL